MQALVKLAMEPEWEARFEPNSYGFRPGRSAQDAISAIFNCINQRAKYVLDADIEKCFDRIDHRELLSKLDTIPTFRRIIQRWLKAGVVEEEGFTSTEAGTPQRGVISPLLANIALHGMEEYVQCCFRQRRISPTRLSPKITLIRYADDLVVLHEDKAVIERCKEVLAEWLQTMGLTMKPSKTRIIHTLEKDEEGKVGFEFLGMEIRQYKVGKTHSGKDPRGNRLGYKTIIKPSKPSQKEHIQVVGQIIRLHRTSPQEALIRHINPLIRGWCNYYAGVVAKDVYSLMDYRMYQILRRWALRRHKSRHRRRIFRKYWRIEKGTWRFETKQGVKLKYHSYTQIKRHVKVYKGRSPYDGDWMYWGKRLSSYSFLSRGKVRLLKWQKGKCAVCGLWFTINDILHEDHIVPLKLGGTTVCLKTAGHCMV